MCSQECVDCDLHGVVEVRMAIVIPVVIAVVIKEVYVIFCLGSGYRWSCKRREWPGVSILVSYSRVAISRAGYGTRP